MHASQILMLLGFPCGGVHDGSDMLRILHRDDPDTTCRCVDQHTLASLQLDETVDLLHAANFLEATDVVAAAARHLCGGLLAGCPEAPGKVMEISGKLYKQYRGMGSLEAMKAGSAARYGHAAKDAGRKVAAEGIEALKEVSDNLDHLLAQLIGGIQAGMGYLGAPSLPELRKQARYIRVSPAGQREAAPHDVIEMKASQ